MEKKLLTLLTGIIWFLMQNVAFGQAPTLGTTSTFALFTAVGAFTNDGASVVTGDVGTNVGAFTAFPPGTLVGLKHVADPGSASAATDVLVAYGFLAALTPLDVIGVGLGGPGEVTIGPGVHSIGAAATLNGTLTLDGGGDPNALFIFKINGAFATAANSRVELINLANPCNVYWQINGQFDLQTGSVFVGTVISSGPINLFVGSSLFGRGLSTAGAISVHTALVTIPVCSCSITAPTVGTITQPDCFTSTGSVVLGGLPAAGNWSINPGAIAGSGTTRTITGLVAGTYNFTVTNDAGCISAPSGNVVINTYTYSPALTAPTVVLITQPTCTVPTGSVELGGLPAGTWTINPGGITGTGATTTISGLAIGTHNYTVTNATECYVNSLPSADIVINAVVTIPTVTLTQPTSCTSHSGTITVTGLTGDCFKYSIDGSTYTNTTGIFTGVPAGTYTVTAINPDGCISTGTSVKINGLPSYTAPTVGTITQPTCEVGTGSVVLNGLPSTGNWFINPGGIAGTGTTKTIYGLAPGTYNFTVTSPGVCWNYSAPSANILINSAIVAAPTVTLTQPTTCTTPTGTITITAPAGLNYSIDGSNYTNTTGIFTLVAPGTYLVTAKNGDGCISSGTSVMINAQPVTLASATAQPTCTVITGTITVVSPTGAGMTYSIDGFTYTNTTGVFTLVPVGIYTVTSKGGDGCISLGTRITIIAPGHLVAPTTTVTQPTTCVSPAGTITVTAPTGAGMTYSIDGSTYTNTDGLFTSVSPGTYTITAKNADGCVSLGTTVTLNALPVTLASVTLQPTCTAATGTITVTAPTGAGMTYSIDGSGYTNSTGIFTLVAAGTYNVTSKSLAGCISSVKSVTINTQPASPAAPTVALIQPTGSVPTGTITLTGLPVSCNSYSIDNSVYTNTTGIFSGVIPGTYTVTKKDWYNGCISPGTSATINDFVTVIDDIGINAKFEIYPVPNDGQFTVVINTQNEEYFDILITNALGSKIFEEKNIIVKGRLVHIINIRQAPAGLYFIMFRSNEDQVIRRIILFK
jgi:hypothetical protein